MGKNSQVQIPLEIQVLNRRAMEMSDHGNYLDALKIFSCVVFIAPHFARAQYEMGRCLDNLGRHNEAIERYGRAMRFDPLFAQVRPVTDKILKNMGSCHEKYRSTVKCQEPVRAGTRGFAGLYLMSQPNIDSSLSPW